MHSEEKIKGAFKDWPKDQQPERIPVKILPQLEDAITKTFCHLGEIHFPSRQKNLAKETTGDLDVLFVPQVTTWKEHIALHPCVIASQGNSAQMMTVMRGLLGDSHQYMIDFLVVKPGGLEFKKLFYGYGTTFSALLGSFARSIGYKFTDYVLYKRVKDNRGQWHNYKLTTDPDKALQILGLDSTFRYDDNMFTPEGVAAWIASSERFDTNSWKHGNVDKIAVGIPLNKNARDAIKKKEDTCDAYDLIDLVEKYRVGEEPPYLYEKMFLGEEFVTTMIRKINEIKINSDIILSGLDIMETLQIPPGPKIGEIQRYLSRHYATLTDEQKQSIEVKEQARELIKLLHR